MLQRFGQLSLMFTILGCQGVTQSGTQPVSDAESGAASVEKLASPDSRSVEIIAHRGASHDAPENTLSSVNLAWDKGADAVEVDIWLSRDNRVFAMHDKTPKRYGGPDRLISEMTWEELSALDVGTWKSPRFRGERVPLLSEILRTVPDGKRLFVEIKCGPEVLPHLESVFEQSGIPNEKIVLIGFDSETMRLARKRFPRLEMYWLVSLKKDKATGRANKSLEGILSTFADTGATGLDLGGETSLLTSFVSEINERGIPWCVWTVNSAEEARRLSELGALGITTDRPDLLLEAGVGVR